MRKVILILWLLLSLVLAACGGGDTEDTFELPAIEGLEHVTIEARLGYMYVINMMYSNWLTEQGFSWDEENFGLIDATDETRREAERIAEALFMLERELDLYPENHNVVAIVRNAEYFNTVLELLYRAYQTRVLPGYFCGPWQLELTFFYSDEQVIAYMIPICSGKCTDVDLLLAIPEFMAMVTVPPELSAIVP